MMPTFFLEKELDNWDLPVVIWYQLNENFVSTYLVHESLDKSKFDFCLTNKISWTKIKEKFNRSCIELFKKSNLQGFLFKMYPSTCLLIWSVTKTWIEPELEKLKYIIYVLDKNTITYKQCLNYWIPEAILYDILVVKNYKRSKFEKEEKTLAVNIHEWPLMSHKCSGS